MIGSVAHVQDLHLVNKDDSNLHVYQPAGSRAFRPNRHVSYTCIISIIQIKSKSNLISNPVMFPRNLGIRV